MLAVSEAAHDFAVEEEEGEEEEEEKEASPEGASLLHSDSKRSRACASAFVGVLLLVCAVLLVAAFVFAGGTRVDAAAQSWRSARLPSWQKPLEYLLHLDVDPVGGTFGGTVDIQVSLSQSSTFFVVHAVDLSIEAAWVVFADGQRLNASTVKPQQQFDMLVVSFQQVLSAARYTLHFGFRGTLGGNMVGLYASTYPGIDGEQQVLAVSQFEATDARRAFPSFDEPRLKARFRVSLRAPPEYTALLSNTPAEASADGVVRFAVSPPMSTYLVALCVSKFRSVSSFSSNSSNSSAVPVYTWGRPEIYTSGAYAARVASALLRSYGDYFGEQYPLAALNLLAVPDFEAGAEENWGLIAYRETDLMYDPQETGTLGEEEVAFTTAHEVAHQWFGNLVTMRWWNELWLKEGFATLIEYQGVDSVRPEWRIWRSFTGTVQQEALLADSLVSSRPAVAAPEKVETPEQIDSQYDSIAYAKGASLLRMLEAHLGASSFRRGLMLYLERHRYSSASVGDLWSALSSQAQDVSQLMTGWVAQPGYPVVMPRQGISSCKYQLTQTRFYQYDGDRSGSRWMIPVSYRSVTRGVSTEASLVMPQAVHESACLDHSQQTGSLLILNVNRTGFFRVFYPRELLAVLISDITGTTATHQSIADVSGLLNDLVAFSKTRRFPINVTDIFALVDAALGNHLLASHALYSSVVKALEAVRSHCPQDSPLHHQVTRYMRAKLAPLLHGLGFNVTEADHDANMARRLLISTSVRLGVDGVRAQMVAQFEALTAGHSVHPDLRAEAFKAALWFTDNSTQRRNYAWLLDRYQRGASPADAERIAGALPYAASQLPRLLQDCTRVIRRQHLVRVVAAVARRSPQLAWHWLRSSFEELRAMLTTYSFPGLLRAVCRPLGAQQAERVSSFLASKGVDAALVAEIKESILHNNPRRRRRRRRRRPRRGVGEEQRFNPTDEQKTRWHEDHGSDLAKWLSANHNYL